MVALELSDMITAEGVRAQAPRLTDAFLTTIYGAIASGKVMSGGVLDVAQVKSKLGDAASKVLGKGMVHDVLIQIVMPTWVVPSFRAPTIHDSAVVEGWLFRT